MQTVVWLRVVRFRAIWFGVVCFGALYMNLRQPQLFECQIKGKIPCLAFEYIHIRLPKTTLIYLQVEIFSDHMELRPVFVYILHIYKNI
jgi:hypothetical protein